MNLTVRIFGVELLHVDLSKEASSDLLDVGDVTTTASGWGFTPSVRWDADVVE